jgi:hypothetical protein
MQEAKNAWKQNFVAKLGAKLEKRKQKFGFQMKHAGKASAVVLNSLSTTIAVQLQKVKSGYSNYGAS